MNLLFNIGFNKEVAKNTALYWDKSQGSLSTLLEKVLRLDQAKIDELGKKSYKRISEEYNWQLITKKYNDLFLSDNC